MVVAAEPQMHWLARWAAGLAIAAVLLGVRFHSMATVAVLFTALTLTLTTPPPALAVMSGLCATAYLVMRHASGPNSAAPTRATALAALGFGLVGAVVPARRGVAATLGAVRAAGSLCHGNPSVSAPPESKLVAAPLRSE
ncbi:MAG: hypothetical protein QOI01_2703, partial [Mycobacterium sp.]|nr:hypothetical protein [Mycobacterium sp.]